MLIDELKEVIAKVEQLRNDEQRAIAKMLREELAWNESFNSSEDHLSNLANEAIEDYRSNKR